MTAIKLVCPTGQDRVISGIDLDVAHGDTVEVPDEIAGRPPKPPKGEPGSKGYDPGDLGEGLLAQHEVWVPASGDSAKTARKGTKEES